MTTKDLRIIKTLQQIDRALLELLNELPFQKITVQLLCERALINRSTFYKYYTDKYDLLDRYLNKILQEFKQQVNVDFVVTNPSVTDDEHYQIPFRNFTAFVYSKRKEYLILWKASIERQPYNEMTDLVYRQILEKLLTESPELSAKHTYCELYAHLFSSNMMALIRWWLTNEDTVSIEEVQKIMHENMKKGLFYTFRHSVRDSIQ